MKNLILLISIIVNLFGIDKNIFILNHDGLMDKRAQNKIIEIGKEAKQKLGINIYLNLKEDNGIDTLLNREDRIRLMKQKEKELVKKLKQPYAVLSIAVNQMYANILISSDLENIINKDDILDNYVIPLLASKDKNTLFAKTSASSLNGFAQIADSVADSKNIKLISSIGSAGKTAGTIWKVFIYTLVIVGLVLYIVIIMREKKYKKLYQDRQNGRNQDEK